MTPSDNLIRFLMREEGFRAEPYNDSGGNATVGYGHLLHLGPVRSNESSIRMSKAEAVVLLRKDAETASSDVPVLGPSIQLAQREFDALTSWLFNLGITKTHDSTLASCLRAGKYALVPVEMMRWCNPGRSDSLALLNRRRREAYLWITGDYGALPELPELPEM